MSRACSAGTSGGSATVLRLLHTSLEDSTMYETYEATHTIFPTMPDGYYIPSTSTGVWGAASSSAGAYASSASAVVSYVPSSYRTAPASAPAVYGSSSLAQPATYTSINTITIIASTSSAAAPTWGASAPPAPYPVAPSGGNSTAWGTATASASYPSSTSWVVPATGGADARQLSLGAAVLAVMAAVVLA